jgi:nucleoside-diphosphate-sugar epimerase
MLGAYDTKPGSGKLLLMGFKRKLMLIPKGGKNFVAAHDVAIAVCNALTMGKNGERYLASGVNLSFKEYYTLQKQVGNYKQRILVIPDFVLSVIGKVGDITRKFGIKTELCSMNVRQLIIREYYTNEKAKAELNLPETDLKIAINETMEWFKKTGKIN